MATWTEAALTYAANSLLTSTKISQLGANLKALAEGAGGAPRILGAAIDETDAGLIAKNFTFNRIVLNDYLTLQDETGKGIKDDTGHERIRFYATTANDTYIGMKANGELGFGVDGVIFGGLSKNGEFFPGNEANNGKDTDSRLKWKLYTVAVDSGNNFKQMTSTIAANKIRYIAAGAYFSGVFESGGGAYPDNSDNVVAIKQDAGDVLQFNYGDSIKTFSSTLWAVVYYVS